MLRITFPAVLIVSILGCGPSEKAAEKPQTTSGQSSVEPESAPVLDDAFWQARLVQALGEDPKVRERVREGRNPERYGPFDPSSLEHKGLLRPVEIEGLDDLVVEPVRFFTVNELVFAAPKVRWTPSRYIRFAIRKDGTGVPVNLEDGVENLRQIFKPVEDVETALRAGIAIARLNALCPHVEKWRPIEVDPAACSATQESDGGYSVVIPAEAVALNTESPESALVRFGPDGKLLESRQTGEQHMHR